MRHVPAPIEEGPVGKGVIGVDRVTVAGADIDGVSKFLDNFLKRDSHGTKNKTG